MERLGSTLFPSIDVKERRLSPTVIPQYSWMLGAVLALLLLAYSGINGLLENNLPCVIFSVLFSLLFIWVCTGSFITSCLFISLDKCLKERRLEQLEMLCSKALQLLNALPVHKGTAPQAIISLLALARFEQGNYKSAEVLYRDSLQQAQSFHDRRGGNEWIPTIAILHNNLASACTRQGKHIEADLLLEQAMDLCERTKMAQSETYIAYLYLATADIRYDLNELRAAEQHILKALQLIDTLPEPLAQETFVRNLIVHCDLQLAALYATLNTFAKADDICERIFAQEAYAFSGSSLKWLNILAIKYMEQQKLEYSARLIEIAYRIASDCHLHPDARQVLDCYQKQLTLTDRQADVADMRQWLLPLNEPHLAGEKHS